MKSKKIVPSPCISVCTMDDATGYCMGCFRTIQEIGSWDGYEDAERKKVWDAIALRRSQVENAHPQ